VLAGRDHHRGSGPGRGRRTEDDEPRAVAPAGAHELGGVVEDRGEVGVIGGLFLRAASRAGYRAASRERRAKGVSSGALARSTWRPPQYGPRYEGIDATHRESGLLDWAHGRSAKRSMNCREVKLRQKEAR